MSDFDFEKAIKILDCVKALKTMSEYFYILSNYDGDKCSYLHETLEKTADEVLDLICKS